MDELKEFYIGCKRGDIEKVKASRDVDLSNVIDAGLIEACRGGYLDIVKLLVDYGVDIHDNNEMALRTAAHHQHFELVQFLIEKGADMTIYHNRPLTLLIESCKDAQTLKNPIIENILQKYFTQITPKNREYLLEFAKTDVVREVIDFNQLSDKEIKKILKKAIKQNDIKIIEEFVGYTDDSFLAVVLAFGSLEAYQLINKTSTGIKIEKALSEGRLDIAYAVLVDLPHDEPYAIINQFNPDNDDIFESYLPHLPEMVMNARESYALLILSKSYNDPATFKKIVFYRHNFGLQDSNIIQLFCEREYSVKRSTADGNIVEILNIFATLDLRSDTEGYLAQIAAMHGCNKLLELFANGGSNIERFLRRFETNRLSDGQSAKLEDRDESYKRTYNVYRKFDSVYKVEDESIQICRHIVLNHQLNKNLYPKDIKKSIKI